MFMEWNEYQKRFIESAQKAGKSDRYCIECLKYAEQLWKRRLPIIYSQEHLCFLLGYSPIYIYAVSNGPESFYRKFEIEKKNGGVRKISEPLPSLKEIQKWILNLILSQMEISPYAKAYVKGKSIKENVRFHRQQKKVLSIDVEKFFDNLSSWLVYQKFLEVGYGKDVAIMLTNLCCLNGALPQGAPTSALLSNILLEKFDDKIAEYTKARKIRYTRYADDMTFSGDFDELELIRYIRKELAVYGLKINEKKTRVRCQGQQQEITGIVVNSKPQISKQKRKK